MAIRWYGCNTSIMSRLALSSSAYIGKRWENPASAVSDEPFAHGKSRQKNSINRPSIQKKTFSRLWRHPLFQNFHVSSVKHGVCHIPKYVIDKLFRVTNSTFETFFSWSTQRFETNNKEDRRHISDTHTTVRRVNCCQEKTAVRGLNCQGKN